jgi:hypothetical protein
MSKVLNTATVIIMLGLAATGAAHARGANFCCGGLDHAGPVVNTGSAYAGPTSLQHYHSVHHLANKEGR